MLPRRDIRLLTPRFCRIILTTVVKIIVIIASVIGLLWFGVLTYNEKNFDQGIQESFNECMRISKEGGSYNGQCMQSNAEAKKHFGDLKNYAAVLGILLPIIFLTAVSLGKHLFVNGEIKK